MLDGFSDIALTMGVQQAIANKETRYQQQLLGTGASTCGSLHARLGQS